MWKALGQKGKSYFNTAFPNSYSSQNWGLLPYQLLLFKRGTPFLTMTEKTLASIAIAFSYVKVSLGSTLKGSSSFAPGAELRGNTAGTLLLTICSWEWTFENAKPHSHLFPPFSSTEPPVKYEATSEQFSTPAIHFWLCCDQLPCSALDNFHQIHVKSCLFLLCCWSLFLVNS